MKILVTGSTGFIGANLCKALVEKGHKVNALYRSEAAKQALDSRGISFCKGDIMDRSSIRKALEGCQQLFHTAAFTRIWSGDPEEAYRLNVLGTLNILEEALEAGVKDIVLTSTAGVMGPSSGEMVNEDSKLPAVYFTEYERTKAIAEKKAQEYLSYGLNIRFVSPTRVFGPGRLSQSNSVTRMILGYASGKWRIIPGNGYQKGNYVFIEDVVEGHIKAMEKGETGHKYLLGGHNLSYNEFFEILAGVCGNKRLMLKLPLPFMTIIANAAMATNALAGIPPFITPQLVKKYNHHWLVSSRKAKHELGIRITPMEEAFSKTLMMLKEN